MAVKCAWCGVIDVNGGAAGQIASDAKLLTREQLSARYELGGGGMEDVSCQRSKVSRSWKLVFCSLSCFGELVESQFRGFVTLG